MQKKKIIFFLLILYYNIYNNHRDTFEMKIKSN